MGLLNNRKHTFFDQWEELLEDQRQSIIRQNLINHLQHALKFPFYQKRIGQLDFGKDNPLLNCPTMSSDHLRANIPPLGNQLLLENSGDYTVFQSGGTTGLPKTTLFTHQELEALNLPNARGFYAVGLGSKDRVANLFAVGGLYMTFIHINRMLQQFGCINFPFSNHTPVDFIHGVAKHFKINCITGIASVGLSAFRGLYDLGLDGIEIDKFYYGGEHLYPADKRELQEKFGVKIIAAPGYGTVDTWYIGYQCTECPTGVFHAHDDQTYIEIINEENGQSCLPDEIGMIYVTPYTRKLTPVIRYQVGDLAKWIKTPCSCGRTTPLFQLFGRGDDILRIGFDSIAYNDIQAILNEVPGLLGTLQMEKRRSEGKDLLIIRVESDQDPKTYYALSDKLENLILNNRPSLRGFVEKKTVWPIKIEISGPNTIPLNPRTGKLIRVIDMI